MNSNFSGRFLKIGQFSLRIILMLVGVLAPILLFEAALRVNAWISDGTPPAVADESEPPPNWEAHPSLRLRVVPNAPGHDSRGFRNNPEPTEAYIVAIGDSQTYGTNVEEQDAWPYQLAELADISVYNMGRAWSGPAHYYTLAQTELLQLKPKIATVAIYTGNDFVDAYDMVYEFESDAYLEFRDTAVEHEPLGQEILRSKLDLWQKHFDIRQANYLEFETQYRGEVPALERFFQNNTRLYWWLVSRGIVTQTIPKTVNLAELAARQWALDNPQDGLIYEDEDVGTVLTTSIRDSVLDLDDPVVAEGFRLTQQFLIRLDRDLESQNIKFFTVIIPTKELVFASRVRQAGISDPVLEQLVENEERTIERLLAYCSDNDIICLDMTMALNQALDAGIAVYPTKADGHPTGDGYNAIATAIWHSLQDLGWISDDS